MTQAKKSVAVVKDNANNASNCEKVAKIVPSIIVDVHDTNAVTIESAKILKSCKSISVIKTKYTEYSNVYGVAVWKSIFSRCKSLRQDEINAVAEKVTANFKDYSNALNWEYKRLDKDTNFKTLQGYINGDDIRDYFKSATDFVATFFPNVIGGNPASLVSYVYKDGYIVKAYAERKLTAMQAVSVLSSSLSTAVSIARKRVGLLANGKDIANHPVDNERTDGKIVSVYVLNADGTQGEKIANGTDLYKVISKANVAELPTLSDWKKEHENVDTE